MSNGGSASCLLQAPRRPSSRSSLPRENKLLSLPLPFSKSSTMWSVPALLGDPHLFLTQSGGLEEFSREARRAGAVLKPGIWGGLAKANPSC